MKSSQSSEENQHSNNHNKIEESWLCSLDYNALHSPIIVVMQNAVWLFIFRSIGPWNLIFWHIHLFLPIWVFPFWGSACQGILKWFYKRLVHLKYSNGNLRIISKKWIKNYRFLWDNAQKLQPLEVVGFWLPKAIILCICRKYGKVQDKV